jgi:two-component sensor histidine kinase
MPFLEVQQIAISSSRIWLAGPEGVLLVNRDLLANTNSILPVILGSVRVNGRDTTTSGKLQLTHRQNDLRFSYIGLHYLAEGPVTYRYRLRGLDKDWRFTQDTVVSYPGLPPGNYAFEVAAGDEYGQWSAAPVQVELEISSAFWQRWWFIPLMVLVLLILSAAVAWYFLRQWQRGIQREKNLELWKMKALRARMDPHFIFNTLNTIQAYITTHDTLAAEKYLNKFSRLVRLVLHQSDAEMISLSEEVELLVLYLELEQMRFGGQFEFEIVVDPLLDRDFTSIPGMLVQPLAENAIKHGLLPRTGGGQIRITYSSEQGQIRCTVYDNGIGREAARRLRERRTDEHRSAGLDLVRSRLQLLGATPVSGDLVSITDLKDAKGNPAGTEISFYIPFTLKH